MNHLTSDPTDDEDTQKLRTISKADKPARRSSPIPRRPASQTVPPVPAGEREPEKYSREDQFSRRNEQKQQGADLAQRETVILPAQERDLTERETVTLPAHETDLAQRETIILPAQERDLTLRETRVLPARETDPTQRETIILPALTAEEQPARESGRHSTAAREEAGTAITALQTHKLPALSSSQEHHSGPARVGQRAAGQLSPAQALWLAGVLLMLILNASTNGLAQILGPQGWAFVLNAGPAGSQNTVLQQLSTALRHPSPTAGTATPVEPKLTPQQYIDLIVQNMSLDQKLGQMLFVQFTGPSYSLDLSTMISQYNVGAVILFTVNNNIYNATQLRQLTQQIQAGARSSGSGIPMIIAIDQEGGLVDRLRNLDGPRPSAAEIGASNDPNRAREAGLQDAHDLASYGINLNLAPVVDVTSVYNPQLYTRTFGNDPATVTRMAAAYLEGLQESGKVLGTLKHFPGLGDVSVDPHSGLPYLTRSLAQLEAIDWAPYRTLIQQGDVHAVMVTHEIVTAVDSSTPSSLSPKVITGILRDELGFQGVVITDSLTMEGVTAHYSEDQAAVMAVKAGADLLMGPISAQTAAQMLQALKNAVQSGDLSQQRIDASVQRILMLKYEMGLLQLPE